MYADFKGSAVVEEEGGVEDSDVAVIMHHNTDSVERNVALLHLQLHFVRVCVCHVTHTNTHNMLRTHAVCTRPRSPLSPLSSPPPLSPLFLSLSQQRHRESSRKG